MKKLLAMVLAAVFLLSLSACEKSGSSDKKDGEAKNAGKKASEKVSDKTQAPDKFYDDDYYDINESRLPDGIITRDEALNIALNHAGLKVDAVRGLDIDFDRERGRYEWEIDFDHEGYEYSYDINAESGEIIHSEKEFDD